MPLMASRLLICSFLVSLCVYGIFAQTTASNSPVSTVPVAATPTSGEIMRGRVAKAKAYVAVKNYTAAIYELEGIRRETSDPTLTGVIQVMLMNCYLEQSDYKRAQNLLTEVFNNQKAGKSNANFFAVAGQTVKGARVLLERYRSLGLSVSDRNLPAEAVADLEKMRETVEMVVQQSKALSENKKLAADSMALLEEASNSRGGLARDDYDAKRWKDEVADARENLVNSRSVVLNAAGDAEPATALADKTLAANVGPLPKAEPGAAKIVPVTSIPNAGQPRTEKIEVPKPAEKTPVKEAVTETRKEAPKMESAVAGLTVDAKPDVKSATKPDIKPESATEVAKDQSVALESATRERRVGKQESTTVQAQPKIEEKVEAPVVQNQSASSETQVAAGDSPLVVGSLLEYATQKVSPTYPPMAKTMRTTGTVKIELVVDEQGVAQVQNSSGPKVLVKAAEDAVKRWKFKPFVRDGQPVKATGFVNFNFNL